MSMLAAFASLRRLHRLFGDDTHAVDTRPRSAREHGYTLSVVSLCRWLRAWRSTSARTRTRAEVNVRPQTPCECEQAQDKTSQHKKVPGAPASVANFCPNFKDASFCFCTVRWASCDSRHTGASAEDIAERDRLMAELGLDENFFQAVGGQACARLQISGCAAVFVNNEFMARLLKKQSFMAVVDGRTAAVSDEQHARTGRRARGGHLMCASRQAPECRHR